METITSTHNERIKEAAELARRRRRRDTGRHLAEGPKVVREALAAGLVEEVFATVDALAALELPAGSDVPVTAVADHVLARLADTTTPQGVVAVVRTAVATVADVVGRGLLVVLHGVADPGNAGTIVRTADAAGVAGVVSTLGTVDLHGPKAIRAAAGSTYHLPVVTGIDLAEVVAACRDADQRVLGLDAGAEASVFDLRADASGVALVLGSEAHGLDEASLALLDEAVAVPQWGAAESLNVAAAAAVALYAVARVVHESRISD